MISLSIRTLSILALLLFLPLPARADLQSYVARPDEASAARKISESSTGGVRETVLDLTSQVWRGGVWRHELRIFRAYAQVPGPVAVLVVDGSRGGWRRDFTFERRLAAASGSIVAVLADIPNQPLFFGRREDDLVAHTFARYLETGDEDWPVLLPMAKAAVRAIDAVSALAGAECGIPALRFVVTGASKRGWTAWLAAAADPRVAGIVPVVFDNLNFAAQMAHQVEVWGDYSAELADYSWRGLQKQIATERGAKLVAMVDPWAHRERLTSTAKLVVNGTNDPYWVVDSIQQYWDGLGGEKSVLYVPNGGHGIASEDRVLDATAAFVRRIAAGKPMPVLSLEVSRTLEEVSTRLVSNERPAAARLWIARSSSRDFRKARFESIGLSGPAGQPPELSFVRAKDGFYAYFAEADFREGSRRFRLSTPIEVRSAAGD